MCRPRSYGAINLIVVYWVLQYFKPTAKRTLCSQYYIGLLTVSYEKLHSCCGPCGKASIGFLFGSFEGLWCSVSLVLVTGNTGSNPISTKRAHTEGRAMICAYPLPRLARTLDSLLFTCCVCRHVGRYRFYSWKSIPLHAVFPLLR